MKTFLIRLLLDTKRDAADLALESGRALKGERNAPGGFVSREELRQTSRQPHLAERFYSFVVYSVVMQSDETREQLLRRLAPFREQSDPVNSQVQILELPEVAADQFWRHARQDKDGALARLFQFFPWYAERVNKPQGGELPS